MSERSEQKGTLVPASPVEAPDFVLSKIAGA